MFTVENYVSAKMVQSHTHIQTQLTYWLQVWEVPRSISVSIIHQKDSELSKAVVLTVIVYYSRRIHININNGKRHKGQEPKRFQGQASNCPLPSGIVQTVLTSFINHVWQHAQSINTNQGSSPQLWCPEFLLGVGHVRMTDPFMADFSLQPLHRSG